MANALFFKVKSESIDQEEIDFEVVNVEGREAISESYQFKFNLRSAVSYAKTNFLGRSGTFTIQMQRLGDYSTPGEKSEYHGIIYEFNFSGKIKDYYYYQATLSPKLSKLKYTKKSDVFVESGLFDILNSIFKNQEYALDDCDFALNVQDKNYLPSSDCYNRYNFVCQYEESDFNFVNRLLERDGLYYYFEQTPNAQEKLIVTDRKEKYLTRGNNLKFRFLSDQTATPDPDSIHFIEMKSRSVPKQVTIMNFGYEKANLGDNGVISCSAYVGQDGVMDSSLFGEELIYGENFINPENQQDGMFLANIRAQEIYCRSKVYVARSTAVPISAGMRITIEDNRIPEFNGDYLVVEVMHHGQQQLAGMQNLNDKPYFYENNLVLIPAEVQFRPQRVTPWPRIYGTMNALIDGEGDSNYAQLDSKGRYKVRFPFLKESKSGGKGSVWLRLVTPYSGNGYGFHFTLRKGTEVVVAFRGGDPDLPVIMGAVFNSMHENIVTDKNAYLGGVIMTPAGNIFVMDDTKGQHAIGLATNNNWTYYQ